MNRPLKIAVAGASGIGRHHAKWHAQTGSWVVAFLGSRPESLASTTAQLRELFGFEGRGYTRLEELLEAEAPDVVDVCTPNERHFDDARLALAAGCHVLCEKPLVWDPAAGAEASLARAGELVDLARRQSLHLGMCSQYAAAFEQYRRLCPDVEPARAASFEAIMDTLSRGRFRDAASVWIDMGPHPLSLILGAWPTAQIVEGSLEVVFAERSAEVGFTVEADGHRCRCRIAVRDRDEGPLVRRFAFDGQAVDLGGRAGEDGVYRSLMTHAGTEDVGDDFMLRLIRQFSRVAAGAEAAPMVPPAVALQNLELLARVLEAA